MAPRLQLHSLLSYLLGSTNVYFQPPTSLEMSYPCIVYGLSNIDTKFGSNIPYKLTDQYTITVIDEDPDSLIPKKIAALPSCVFDRRFPSENLNHTVFKLSY